MIILWGGKMKHRPRLVFLFFIFLFMWMSVLQTFSMESGFLTHPLPENEKAPVLHLEFLEEEPAKRPIVCFDINSNGFIAIGHSQFEEKTVCVYSPEGLFLYGFAFQCNGLFELEWNSSYLNLYLARSSLLVCINENAEILEMAEVDNALQNNDYLNHVLQKETRQTENAEYTVRNRLGFFNLFVSSYSQLVIKPSGGAEKILYDVNSQQLAKILIIFISFVLIFSILILLVIREIKRREKTKMTCFGQNR